MSLLATLSYLLACGPGTSGPAVEAPVAPQSAIQAPDPTEWSVIRPGERDPERWGGARCNDGRATSVAISRPAELSDQWVIRIAGGFFCDERTLPCSDREERHRTPLAVRGKVLSDGEIFRGAQAGLFSRDPVRNPDLHGANQVLLHYCSSDLWLGEDPERQPNSGSAEGWYFTGRSNFRAGIEVLDLEPEAAVLIVAQSSGGIGLSNNLHLVRELFAPQIERGRLDVVFEGAWVPDLEMRDEYRIARWGSPLPACAQEMRSEGRDPDECLFGPTWYPFWKEAGVDVLIAQSALDITQLEQVGVETALEREAWRDRTKASLQIPERVVSGGFRYHVFAFDPRVGDSRIGRMFRDQVGALLRDREPTRVFHRYEDPP